MMRFDLIAVATAAILALIVSLPVKAQTPIPSLQLPFAGMNRYQDIPAPAEKKSYNEVKRICDAEQMAFQNWYGPNFVTHIVRLNRETYGQPTANQNGRLSKFDIDQYLYMGEIIYRTYLYGIATAQVAGRDDVCQIFGQRLRENLVVYRTWVVDHAPASGPGAGCSNNLPMPIILQIEAGVESSQPQFGIQDIDSRIIGKEAFAKWHQQMRATNGMMNPSPCR